MSEESLYRSNIDRIRSVARTSARYRQASPARYEIAFSHPFTSELRQLSTSAVIQSRLSDSCEVITMPGRGHSSQANTIYGAVREMPYQVLYSGDLDMTFRVGADYLERHYFEEWSNFIVSKRTNNYTYYDEYASSLSIRALSRSEEVLYEMTVNECYPKQLGAIDFGYEKVDELTKFNVSLAFRNYDVTYYSPINPTTPPPPLPPNVGGPGGAPNYGGPNDPFAGDTRYA